MKIKSQGIPEAMIYELVAGKAIYYKGYKDYLAGIKSLESLMGSSFLQAILIAKLVAWLQTMLGEQYIVLTNEVGLQIDAKNWRLADIALLNQNRLSTIKNVDKYLPIPPDYVIEIDTKAAFDDAEQQNGFDYFQEKTDALLKFGVKKVIWIFTQNRKILVAEPDKAWVMDSWDKLPVEIDGFAILLKKLLPDNL